MAIAYSKAGIDTILGAAQNWANQLTTGLNPVTSALAASTTVPGVVQLATVAQALAGTDNSAAITSLALNSARSTDQRIWKVNSLSALNTLGSTFISQSRSGGELASLQDAALTTGSVNYALWFWYGSKWYPLDMIYLNATGTASGFASDVAAQSNLAIAQGVRINASNTNYELGTDGQWRRTSEGVLTGWGYDGSVTAWDGTFTNEFRLLEGGRLAEFSMGVAMANNGVFPNQQRLIYGISLPPKRNYFTSVPLYGNAGWGSGIANIQIDTIGGVTVLATTNVTSARQGIFGTIQWPLT